MHTAPLPSTASTQIFFHTSTPHQSTPTNLCLGANARIAMANASVDKAVKKSVKGDAYIDDDEYNQNKIMLGLGCALVAIGAPLIGFAGKVVDKARKQRK